ncbi:FHA domain-containing protein [Parabacteroides sp.]
MDVEKNIKTKLSIFIAAIASLFMLDGNNLLEKYGDNHKTDHIKDISVRISPDGKMYTVNLELSDSISRSMIMMNQRIDSIAVEEKNSLYGSEDKVQPKVVQIEEAHQHRFDSIHTLVIVDLTLSQEQVDAQKNAVTSLFRTTFNNNLHIRFAGSGRLSELMPVSDFVLENMFVAQRNENYLYKDIIEQYNQIRYDKEHRYGISSWSDIPNDKKILFVFSDEETYRNGSPIDYSHYERQQELHWLGLEASEDSTLRVPFYYVSFNNSEDSNALDNTDGNILSTRMRLKNFCEMTGGRYFNTFNYSDIFDQVSLLQNIHNLKFKITLENPDRKTYIGSLSTLKVSVYTKGNLLGEGRMFYSLSHFYDPLYVNFQLSGKIIFIGVIYVLLLLAIVYISLQFVYPYIRYTLVFRRKYVTRFTDEFMAYDGNIVEQECYYCKGRFAKGDEIVTKCKHTTHLRCWKENKYRCSEYGENCKDGKFYYNQENLFDIQNAPFVMRWLLYCIATALVIWLTYFIIKRVDMPFVDQLFVKTLAVIDRMEILNTSLSGNISSGKYLYKYGFTICFWITLVLGFLSTKENSINHKAIIRVSLSVLSGLGGAFVFFVYAIITTPADSYNNALLLVLFIWLFNSLIITLTATYATSIISRKIFISVFITTFFAVLSLAVLSIYSLNKLDCYYIQLIFNTIYCIGFALSFAFIKPMSRRYFLRVEGCVKPMDVALFKWFNGHSPRYSQNEQRKDDEVLIGSSIDCSVHLDWDLDKSVAPIHASVRRINNSLYVVAHEPMKINQRPARIGKRYRLYHKTEFEIGKTKFTYLEKDK